MHHPCMQVLSESVSKGLQMYREQCSVKANTEATEQFTLLMDRFFDIFNVRDLKEGKKQRKSTRDPFYSANDWRFDVCYIIHIAYNYA